MRIFYASDNTPNASLNSNLWRNNLYSTLVEMGHDVVEFDYDLRETFQNLDPNSPKQREFIEHNRPKLEQELLRQIRAAHSEKPIELFFSYFYAACATKETIEQIRAMGIKAVNWYCNGSYQFHLVEALAPGYDLCMVPEKFRMADYRRVGATPLYCQEAANPNIYKPYDVPVEYDVTFIGQSYGERPAYISYLYGQGIDVRVWGFGWQNLASNVSPIQRYMSILKRAPEIGYERLIREGFRRLRHKVKQSVMQDPLGSAGPVTRVPAEIIGPPLSDEEMVQMYSRSKINLGFSSCGNTHETDQRILQVRLRDFEVPMSGGFYMVEYMEELEEFYEIGKEIVCYSGPEDLAEKIKYYLAHETEREKIRQAGYARCLRDHTWRKRFEAVFEAMGLPQASTTS